MSQAGAEAGRSDGSRRRRVTCTPRSRRACAGREPRVRQAKKVSNSPATGMAIARGDLHVATHPSR